MNKAGSKEWWLEKYQASKDYLFGKAPSDFLTENLQHLSRGNVFDVGLGEGRNAVYLASKGFQVTGLDFCETAIERAKDLALGSGVSIECKAQDLDFHLIPIMSYDNILVVDTRPPLTILKNLSRGLKKGGVLLIDAYTTAQIGRPGYQPDFVECFKPGELLDYVRDLHLLCYDERFKGQEAARVRLIARKSSK